MLGDGALDLARKIPGEWKCPVHVCKKGAKWGSPQNTSDKTNMNLPTWSWESLPAFAVPIRTVHSLLLPASTLTYILLSTGAQGFFSSFSIRWCEYHTGPQVARQGVYFLHRPTVCSSCVCSAANK